MNFDPTRYCSMEAQAQVQSFKSKFTHLNHLVGINNIEHWHYYVWIQGHLFIIRIISGDAQIAVIHLSHDDCDESHHKIDSLELRKFALTFSHHLRLDPKTLQVDIIM